ncbi:MAG TPA: helix-turn-helix domain-containing protein [Candidatus Ornithomonoglobus merdipullorum]|uniref:Helix-turn-helix domain-containing protein n=1 Tax=Candidatus Ornithomonoglobus merdipullorum TaxID=2840895 RepID=A0A9D1MCK6_9FIRM|nr:helix-turn-helix domain-containing protein [Candidatus Ornithomonoglobus merdipullorum]
MSSEHFEFEKASSGKPMDMGPFHCHDYYEIYFLENGSRRYMIENSVYDIKKYDVVLIPPNVYHKTAGSAFKRRLVEFSSGYIEKYYTSSAAASMLSCFSADKRVVSLSKDDFEYLAALLDKIRCREPEHCYALLAEILIFLGATGGTDAIEAAELSGTLTAAILEYIRSNFKSIASIDEIADHFHITKYYLCRLFKKNTGITIMEYMNSLKIENVKELLRGGTKKSVTEAALESGFNSPIYMSHLFKQVTGMTPRDYRSCASSKPVLRFID